MQLADQDSRPFKYLKQSGQTLSFEHPYLNAKEKNIIHALLYNSICLKYFMIKYLKVFKNNLDISL